VIASETGDEGKLAVMRRGVAFLAGHVWEKPEFRGAATDVLVALAPHATADLAVAWHSVFRGDHAIFDDYLSRLVEAVAASEPLLSYGHIHFFVETLKLGLAANALEPALVCKTVMAMLNVAGEQVGDLQQAWSGFAKDFIDIALTLQNIEETRLDGLEIFERLMAVGAYGVSGVLNEVDRKLPS